MGIHDQLPQCINSFHHKIHKIVYMNIMAEYQQASAHPLSSIIWFLTEMMKHDHIGGTSYLGHQSVDPAQGSIHGCCSHR